MEIRLYFQMLQRGWWVILLAALVAVSVSLGLSYLAVPQYQATASFIITPSATLTIGRDVVNSLDTLDRRSIVATFAEVMNSRRILNEAAGSLDLEEKALVRALKSGKIRGAGLDVYEREPKMASGLASCRNAVLAPHLASATLETRRKMGVMAASGQKM